MEQIWNDHREAAEVHRQVRSMARNILTPGMKLVDLASQMETKARELIGEDGPRSGLAFPISLSKNFIAAHFTPEFDSQMTVEAEDLLKIDFGIHKNGRIVDCAFSFAFEDRYDALMDTVRDATNAGIKRAGIDVKLSEVGNDIAEVFDGAEIEIFQDGKNQTVPSKLKEKFLKSKYASCWRPILYVRVLFNLDNRIGIIYSFIFWFFIIW